MKLDLVLFGATGFTGRLTAEELAARKAPLRWALAGRSRDKLERVRDELRVEVPILVGDSLDAAAMDAIAKQARVVCTTVGPYGRYGDALVAACAENGTHYCDLTGETDWVRRMLDAHHARAEMTGARIVPSCGFDSIPSDLGVFLLGEHFSRRGTRLASARLRVTSVRGGFSGGTFASMLGIAERMLDRETRRAMGNPYALNPEGERRGPDGNGPIAPRRDSSTGHWLAPFLMAPANTRVVRRSNALLGYPWGREFRYEEVVDFGGGVRGLAGAAAVSGAMAGFFGAVALPPTRKIIERFLPQSGAGPSQRTRERGRFRITIDGSAEDGSTAQAHVEGYKDPGYGATAIMLAESGLCLACDNLPQRSGFLTPASAMGSFLVERLRAAGMRLEVE